VTTRIDVVLRRSEGVAEYLVTPKSADEGRALAALGFAAAAGAFKRTFSDSDDVPRTFANFAAHVDEMIAIKLRERPAPWERALELAVKRLTGEVDWWLSGSAALAVRGIDVDPRDVDLVVDDAQRAAALFGDIVVEPLLRSEEWVANGSGERSPAR
jgi:hypothetical protein